VNVAYFAQARELAGTKEDEIVLKDPADMNHLLSEIMNAHPKLQGIRDMLSSLVNGRAVWENVVLNDGDRVTLFPPVGGG
jgi:MoaD family protein